MGALVAYRHAVNVEEPLGMVYKREGRDVWFVV
jgi:hypothetical protein